MVDLVNKSVNRFISISELPEHIINAKSYNGGKTTLGLGICTCKGCTNKIEFVKKVHKHYIGICRLCKDKQDRHIKECIQRSDRK